MANNLIQIKRSLITNTPTTLANGELAYTANGDVLYIGSNSLVVAISGARTPGILTANQALVANSTSAINKILVANLVPTGLWANGQAGGAGNYLASDGANVYWTAPAAGVSGGTAANTLIQYNNSNTLASAIGFSYNNTTNNVTIANTLTIGTTVVNSAVIFSGNSTVNSSGNSTSDILSSTVGTTSLTATSLTIAANASSLIVVGNSTVNTNINSTSFTGTSNNSLSLGGTLASGFQTTAGLAANVATLTANNTLYLGGTLASGYQTTAGLSANVATLTANNTLYLGGTLASGYQTTAGLAANVATLTANNTLYLGGVVAASYALNTSVTTAYTNALADTLSFNRTYTGNNTFAGTNTSITSNVNITGTTAVASLTVSGNLTVTGTTTSINATQLTLNDNIIELGTGNITADITDSGWFSPAGNSTVTWYSGLARIASKSSNNNPYFYIFGSNTNPNTAVTIDTTANTVTGTLQAYLSPYGPGGVFVANSTAVNITANATVSASIIANNITLTTALLATYGGTGVNTYAVGDILFAATTNPTALTKLSVPGTVANGQILQITNNLPSYGTLDGGTF